MALSMQSSRAPRLVPVAHVRCCFSSLRRKHAGAGARQGSLSVSFARVVWV